MADVFNILDAPDKLWFEGEAHLSTVSNGVEARGLSTQVAYRALNDDHGFRLILNSVGTVTLNQTDNAGVSEANFIQCFDGADVRLYYANVLKFQTSADGVGVTGKITSTDPLILTSYTVATVPDAATFANGLIYVSDEAGGAVPAFSDGVNWRRVTDRAIVS